MPSPFAHQPALSPVGPSHVRSGNGRQGVWRLGAAACQASGRGASGLLRIAPNHGSASQRAAVCLPGTGQGACLPFYASYSWYSAQEWAWEQLPRSGKRLCCSSWVFGWDLGKEKAWEALAFQISEFLFHSELVSCSLSIFVPTSGSVVPQNSGSGTITTRV